MNHSTEPSPPEEMTPEEFVGGMPVACVILGLSFLVGAPGNLLVIWTILRHIKQRSHTVVIILHLAAADLLVLITLPLWIYSLAHSWVFGEASCKAMVYIIKACMFSSIFFITLMSVERFLAVCYPFVMMHLKTTFFPNRGLVLVWFFALMLGIPTLVTQSLEETDGTEQCFLTDYSSETQVIVFLCLETVGGFVAPFIILTVCNCLAAAKLRKICSNSKHKSMVLIYSVVIAFAICWLPFHIINVIDTACILRAGPEQVCVHSSIVFVSGALVFISSSVNPVLYIFFARNYQRSLKESQLVRLFQEMVTFSSKATELVVQRPAGQRAAPEQTSNSE